MQCTDTRSQNTHAVTSGCINGGRNGDKHKNTFPNYDKQEIQHLNTHNTWTHRDTNSNIVM